MTGQYKIQRPNDAYYEESKVKIVTDNNDKNILIIFIT